jgi:hypothetical protein
VPGGGGGAAPGTRGAAGGLGGVPVGGRGAELRVVSGSDMYGERLSAPMSIPAPPVFRSLGMPPASIPANWGGPPPPPVSPLSLLLLARFGGGGAKPLGGRGGAPPGEGLLAMPGIGGAPMTGAGALSFLSSIGADLSLIWVTFLNRAPDSMLLRSAPYSELASPFDNLSVNVAYSASTLRLLLWRQSSRRRRRRRRRTTSSSTHSG